MEGRAPDPHRAAKARRSARTAERWTRDEIVRALGEGDIVEAYEKAHTQRPWRVFLGHAGMAGDHVIIGRGAVGRGTTLRQALERWRFEAMQRTT